MESPNQMLLQGWVAVPLSILHAQEAYLPLIQQACVYDAPSIQQQHFTLNACGDEQQHMTVHPPPGQELIPGCCRWY